MCSTAGAVGFAAASEDQERGRLGNLGTCGTGDPSFSGEHGLRVARGFISVLNAANEDDRERVCSGVSVATSPAGDREKLRRRTKPGRAGEAIEQLHFALGVLYALFSSRGAVSRVTYFLGSPLKALTRV